MTTKTKVILVILALISTFSVGRLSAPTKVVTETKIVEVEKKTSESESERNKHKTTTTTTTKHPDGSETTTTTTSEDSTTDKKTATTDDLNKTSDTVKTVESDVGRVTISALAGLKITDPTPTYGVHVTSRIIGPINAGIWGLSSGILGISVGLSL